METEELMVLPIDRPYSNNKIRVCSGKPEEGHNKPRTYSAFPLNFFY